MKFKDWWCRPPIWGRLMAWAWVMVVLIAAIVLSIIFWDWLSRDESSSATIRNIVLAAAAAIAFPVAIWRGALADRQADTAQHALWNERYQRGAEDARQQRSFRSSGRHLRIAVPS